MCVFTHREGGKEEVPIQSRTDQAFTIVELLIVIVVIGILASISIVAYSGIQYRAYMARNASDMDKYAKAIQLAKLNTGKTLGQITGNYWSAGPCTVAGGNTSNTEPLSLPRTHACWTNYYSNIAAIASASGVNLDSMMNGDWHGNPYTLDENEGEGGSCATPDQLYYFDTNGANYVIGKTFPLSGGC